MKRNDAIELLEEYNKLLMEDGYADTDILGEAPNDSAIDRFLSTKWARENLPIESFRKGEFSGLNIHAEHLKGQSIISKIMSDEKK